MSTKAALTGPAAALHNLLKQENGPERPSCPAFTKPIEKEMFPSSLNRSSEEGRFCTDRSDSLRQPGHSSNPIDASHSKPPAGRQDAIQPEAGPSGPLANQSGREGRTTASARPSCERCGKGLTGRKVRFCSDACRMAARRESQVSRVRELLEGLESGVAALRKELEGDREPA